MPTAALILSTPLVLNSVRNAKPVQYGPHYYKSPEFYRNLTKMIEIKGDYYSPIKFDFADKSFAMMDGRNVRLTGRAVTLDDMDHLSRRGCARCR